MHDTEPAPAQAPADGADRPLPDPALTPDADSAGEDATDFSTLRDDVAALVEDARTYAAAEFAFQSTRASLAGKRAGRALVLLVLALVLLHIALIALAVGAVIALAPLVTIWGAIAIVVGVLLAGVAALVMGAQGDGKMLAAMFAAGEDA
jgi:hypothetical protein